MSKYDNQDALKAKESYDSLDAKGKREHFWYYHKKKVIAGVVILIALILAAIITFALKDNKPVNLQVRFMNCKMDGIGQDNNILSKNFKAATNKDSSYRIVTQRTKFDTTDQTAAGQTMENVMIESVGGNLDVLVMDQASVNKFVEGSYVADLKNSISNELLDQYKDKILYGMNEDGERAPMAIEITDLDFCKSSGITTEDKIYIGMAMDVAHQQDAAEFVRYVLGETK